jgi:hypothetical protein
MTDFSPQQAVESLRAAYQDIERIGKVLVEKRKQYVLVEADLIDHEALALKRYFEDKPCKISEMSAWLKSETWDQRATESMLKSEIKALEAELNITVECLNALKTSYRISQLEANNLNLQP